MFHLTRNSHIWLPSLIGRKMKAIINPPRRSGPIHILFCMADHFEPRWNNASPDKEKERVKRWVEMYPELASAHRDSNGRPTQHTWFYAAEEYRPNHLEKLSELCKQGFGEIELHIHHGNDTPEGFRQKLEQAKADFSRHGALITQHNPPQYAFGFIHGNWALNNSRNGNCYCGVDNELKILKEAGCYADFTLPSAPHESQTSKVNSIYYAQDIDGMRKSHNKGIDVKVRGKEIGDLMLIQGPLALNWKRRKYGVLPGIESGCVQCSSPGIPERIDLWVQQHIHVQGRSEWVFIKVYCHGTQEDDIDALLGNSANKMFSYLEEKYNDGKQYKLHYVTAREIYNIIKAAEAGNSGNPFLFRDYLIKPYQNSWRGNVTI